MVNRDGENMILDSVRERIRRPRLGTALKWLAIGVGIGLIFRYFREY